MWGETVYWNCQQIYIYIYIRKCVIIYWEIWRLLFGKFLHQENFDNLIFIVIELKKVIIREKKRYWIDKLALQIVWSRVEMSSLELTNGNI